MCLWRDGIENVFMEKWNRKCVYARRFKILRKKREEGMWEKRRERERERREVSTDG